LPLIRLIAAARDAEVWVASVTDQPQNIYEVENDLLLAQGLEARLSSTENGTRSTHLHHMPLCLPLRLRAHRAV
jgi:hypothetical protein